MVQYTHQIVFGNSAELRQLWKVDEIGLPFHKLIMYLKVKK